MIAYSYLVFTFLRIWIGHNNSSHILSLVMQENQLRDSNFLDHVDFLSKLIFGKLRQGIVFAAAIFDWFLSPGYVVRRESNVFSLFSGGGGGRPGIGQGTPSESPPPPDSTRHRQDTPRAVRLLPLTQDFLV